MNAIDCAMATLFADPNIGFDVVYRALDADPGVSMRANVLSPDAIETIGDARVITGTTIFEIRTAQLSAPAIGDTIEWAGNRYEVQAKPVCRDSLHSIWTLDTVPQ